MRQSTTFCLLFVFMFTSLSAVAQYFSGSEIRIEKKGFNKENVKELYELNITYPIIHFPQSSINHQVNLGIQKVMSMAITDFTEKNTSQQYRKSDAGYSWLNLNYETYYKRGNVLSLKFIKSSYYSGLDKPKELFLTFNFDLRTGKLIKIEDIFKPDADFKQRLIYLIQDKEKECKFKKDHLLSNFCLEDENFIVTLDENTSQPETCEKEIRIAWDKIRDLVKQDGIASELIIQR
ncbi:hypothetical protein AAG747_23210 [Rapidithrix thailandica]|uniref:Uncharacterized protein n=1 Tax=Rapidithrix thailandica TaxID=413964 RepID=A0AAW9SEQ3_9BACT